MEDKPEAEGGIKPKKSAPNLPTLNINLSGVLAASRVYIVEHFLVLITLGIALISGIGLFNSVIDHLMDSDGNASVYSSVISFEQLALYMAMAIVALPLFALLYVRTRKAERAHPELLTSRPRRWLDYLFVGVASLFVLGFIIAFVYTSALTVINAEASASSESWLQSSIKQWFAILYIGLVALFNSRLTPGVGDKEDV